ncbi:axin-1-like [Carassius gibelio]|uniref:axin-1-like n=1 Tax=Carassius gibelio TaxID=101364 RepID=UPI0022787466|nr:axin-1-like [Carassius gibelio]
MSYCGDGGGVFSEDTPRPPVPGEEGGVYSGRTASHWSEGCEGGVYSGRTASHWSEGCEGGVYSGRTASHWSGVPVQRSDVDLGLKPEGSTVLDGPVEPWAETLLTLLEDRDGTALFLRFLQTLGCAPLLEFWFACSGFQKVPEDATERRLKLARAMYRCYLCDGVVSRSISAEARCGIRDSILQLRLDSALFEPAHAQVQEELQDRLFPRFLRSDLYLEHTSPETRLAGHQATPPQGEESEKETLPPHSAANQKRPGSQEHRQRRHACHRHHRTRERDTRHTHLPHTPVKMTPHTFAAELMRRLQELHTHTQTHRHTEVETSAITAFSSCDSLKTLESDCTRPDTRDASVKSIEMSSPAHTHQCVTVVYCYDGELVPYRTCVQGVSAVTLGLFKSLLTRRGSFRFFFKRASAEFDCGAVHEEIREDHAVLPTFDHKIMARVERMSETTITNL